LSWVLLGNEQIYKFYKALKLGYGWRYFTGWRHHDTFPYFNGNRYAGKIFNFVLKMANNRVWVTLILTLILTQPYPNPNPNLNHNPNPNPKKHFGNKNHRKK